MLSKLEINLQRLLKSCEKRVLEVDHDVLLRDPKFYAYVSLLREQLAALEGASSQILPSVTEEKALEYRKRVDSLVKNTDKQIDVWGIGRNTDRSRPADPDPRDPLVSTDGVRHRHRSGTLSVEAISERDRIQLDNDSFSVIDRNRQLQDNLSNDMIELMGQMKENAAAMDLSLKLSDKTLDATELAIDHNLAATNKARSRMAAISSRGWCTACFSWLIILLICSMFMSMVLLIRLT